MRPQRVHGVDVDLTNLRDLDARMADVVLGDRAPKVIPEYSSNLAATESLVDHVRRSGGDIAIEAADGMYRVHFSAPRYWHGWSDSLAESAKPAIAICQAILEGHGGGARSLTSRKRTRREGAAVNDRYRAVGA